METKDALNPGPSPLTMSRREAVWRLAVLMGGAMVGSEVFLSGQSIPGKTPTAAFTDADRALLDKIGDTIVPATDIPGAAAVNIGAFITMMVNECYNDKQHAAFAAGLLKINEVCAAKYGSAFGDSTPAQRTDLANLLDSEQRLYTAKKAKEDPPHYFRMMKELSVLGFFSSEIGCTQAVRYIEVPGAFHGDIAYKKGDRAWY
jgi:Gluconate 2-dehydrogenase subunit 3